MLSLEVHPSSSSRSEVTPLALGPFMENQKDGICQENAIGLTRVCVE